MFATSDFFYVHSKNLNIIHQKHCISLHCIILISHLHLSSLYWHKIADQQRATVRGGPVQLNRHCL